MCLAAADVVFAGARDVSHDDDKAIKAGYHKDMGRILSFHKSKDFGGLQELVEEIERKWGPRSGEYYLDLMATACEMLTTVDFRSGRQGPLGQKYALLTLTRPGPIPLDKEWKLVFCLRQHFDYEKGAVKGEEWSKQRTERARLWFRAWQRLEREIEPDFNPKDRPPAQIPPPPGLGIRAGAPLPPPQAIRDPKVRKQYEEALEEHRKKQEAYARQVELHDLAKRYLQKAEQYVIATYSSPPFNQPELQQYLADHGISQDARARILKEVDRRTTNYLAAQEKAKPSADPFELRRDRRLAVLVIVGGDKPKLEEILQSLRGATGLLLTVADNLADHEPDFGKVNLGAHPRAWQVMEMVAHRQLRNGRWEKTENGYRLTGHSLVPVRPTTNLFVILLLWFLPGIVVVGLTAFYWWRRKGAHVAHSTEAGSQKR